MPDRFKKLVKLAEYLRGANGCPWDKKQTIESMLEHVKEEAEEVYEAIEKGHAESLKEELGDLLFNVIMIAQITKEKGKFDIGDVLRDIEKKIIDRHTWVFGGDKAKTPEEALAKWKENKKKK
ncbi:MAG: MazG nucleotide pyrophosphohydrolase domain-containing protein [Patescibacteria group bacterium]|nr:nucleotide pyrophosphohydrolase [Patescibacteria group bacterium]